jgi:hypothetical protein
MSCFILKMLEKEFNFHPGFFPAYLPTVTFTFIGKCNYLKILHLFDEVLAKSLCGSSGFGSGICHKVL